jgi:DNA-binding response OmpR family regulator
VQPTVHRGTVILEILYVEDDDILRGLYAACLREAGFSVREARLAEEAFHAARCLPPDLVILDLAMPPGEMSGTEVLARLREDQAMAAIPIVLFSGLGDILNPDVVRSLRVAAVVTKPARAHHLVAIVSDILRSRS